jgi:thiol:disulfide interchange protein DsbD
MPSLRRLLFLPLVVAAVLAPGLRGAAPSPVKGSLVAATTAVQPGQPVTVALRLQHDPHWHTYWLNPGTGLPTTLAWQLPPGWTVGPILWPAPLLLRDKTGNIVGHGYEGEILLPVVLTPPATIDGFAVELKAKADWLMCETVCVPGGAAVGLTLPVAGGRPDADPTWGPRIAETLARLPRTDEAWAVSAVREGVAVRLTVRPTGQAAPREPGALRFFDADNRVVYDIDQPVMAVPGGGYTLALKLDPTTPADVARLTGVLTAANGWRADGTLPGLAVDVALAPATSAAAAPAPAGDPVAAGAAGVSLAATLLLALLGGLILNLMPCVFPVLGLKILGFVEQAGNQRGRVAAHGLVFTAGVLVSFWTLAGVLVVLRAGGDQLGWGFQLQSAPFVYGLAVLLLVFALNLSGLFEFGLAATAVGGDLQSKGGFGGSFFTGVLATVVATPSSAPFLAPALGAALTVPPLESFLLFTAIGVGLSAPYLGFSAFPDLVRFLPRPGAWMETFKQLMAFPLYGTVGYLVWVLAAQTSEEGFLHLLLSLVVVAFAVWLYGRWTAPEARPRRPRAAVVAVVVGGALALWLGWPRAVPAPGAGAADVTWEAWSPEAVERLRAEGRVIYVDFTARWCATCQTNKRLVFGSAEVRRLFAARRVATLRADWTNRDPRITAELARYQRSAVPFNVIWQPGRAEPVLLPELLTPGIVLDALGR